MVVLGHGLALTVLPFKEKRMVQQVTYRLFAHYGCAGWWKPEYEKMKPAEVLLKLPADLRLSQVVWQLMRMSKT